MPTNPSPASSDSAPGSTPFDPSSITRPDPALMTYYVIAALCTILGFPFLIIPQIIRYKTLHYSFDDKGVSMAWGILFRKEIYLTYRRIQDIHVTRNIIERWMGLAKVAVQTASGTSGAEMTIEGIRQPEALRDYLYQRMRGAKDGDEAPAVAEPNGGTGEQADTTQPRDELLGLLTDIRDEVRRLADARGERDS